MMISQNYYAAAFFWALCQYVGSKIKKCDKKSDKLKTLVGFFINISYP